MDEVGIFRASNAMYLTYVSLDMHIWGCGHLLAYYSAFFMLTFNLKGEEGRSHRKTAIN